LNRPSTAVHIRLGFREIGEINEAFEGAEYTWGLFQKILKGVEEQR